MKRAVAQTLALRTPLLRACTRTLPLYISFPSRACFSSHTRAEPTLDALVFDKFGVSTAIQIGKIELADKLKVPMRDIRCLDPEVEPTTSFSVRKNAIVLSLQRVKAVITADELMVFDPTNRYIQGLFPAVANKLSSENPRETRGAGQSSKSLGRSNLPLSNHSTFEFHVLEEILVYVTDSMDEIMDAMRPETETLLDTLIGSGNATQAQLERLLIMTKGWNKFESEVLEVKNEFLTLLDNDEDLALMYLTVYRETGHLRRSDMHFGAEIMIENYLKRVQSLYFRIQEVKRTMLATEEFLKIVSSSSRNQILRFSLSLGIGTFAVASASLVAGSFGMNLVSGQESDPDMFQNVVMAMGVGSSAIYATLWGYLKYVKKIL